METQQNEAHNLKLSHMNRPKSFKTQQSLGKIIVESVEF